MFTGALKLKLSLLFLIVIQAGSVQGQSRPEDLKLLFSGLEQVSRLNKSSLGFCPKVEKRTAVCPDFVFRFLKDSQDSKSADLLKSQMNTCYSQFDSQGRQIKNPSVVNQPQWLHEIIKKTNLNELGELANSVGESCAGHFKAHPADYSRFYYATAKLNEAAQVTSKEIVQIQNLLKEPIDQVACPDPIVLQKAHESCEKEKKCPQNQTLSQLALESMRDLETFKKSKKTLEALSSNCKGAGSCQQDVERLSDLVGALILKNPWFLDSDFLSGERYSANYRLSQYFKKRKKHLFQHQSELEKASRCFQFENAENCQVRNIRELLEMSPDLEIKGVSAQEKNKIENLFNFQACQDRVSLERDRTADVVNAPAQALLGMGTQVGTEGILEKIALGRFRSVESAAKIIIPRLSGLFASESALHLMTESSALANIKKSCLDKKVNLQQSQASAGSQKKCSTEESAFGAGQFDESSCMVDLALAAVAASPALGADLAFKKMIGTSRSTNILVDRRAPGAFANRNTNTSRLDQPTNIYLTRSGIDSYMYRRFPTINNRPTSIEIVEVTKVDGRKAYMYTTVDRLKDGTWVRTANEFQMDPITGAIDATSPAGKDLFERMAKAHSGKAHYAFFDVARLGFVNNNFKNLSQDGDLYLKGVADMIQKQGQGKVTLARTGGDEFGLIIHESDPEQVKKILADIRNAIRDDRQGLARKVFVTEKTEKAEEFRQTVARFKSENPDISEEELKELLRFDSRTLQSAGFEDLSQSRSRIENLARTSTPDVSLGATAIGSTDDLNTLGQRSEDVARFGKTETAHRRGLDASKYGDKRPLRERPDARYRSPIETPSPSPSWDQAIPFEQPAVSAQLRPMRYQREREVMRVGDSTVAEYKDELGRVSYRSERYVLDFKSQRKVAVLTDIPTKGTSGLLDGNHPESQHLVINQFRKSPDQILVQPKIRSLKYLNYFGNGTRAGDEVIAVMGELMNRNRRPQDLNFKLNGADFLWAGDGLNKASVASRMNQIKKELVQHPRIKKLINDELSSRRAQIKKLQQEGRTSEALAQEQRLSEIQNFDFDIQFETLTASEFRGSPTLQDIQKAFDEKFKKRFPN